MNLYLKLEGPLGLPLVTCCAPVSSRVTLRADRVGVSVVVDGREAMFVPSTEGMVDPVLLEELALHMDYLVM